MFLTLNNAIIFVMYSFVSYNFLSSSQGAKFTLVVGKKVNIRSEVHMQENLHYDLNSAALRI